MAGRSGLTVDVLRQEEFDYFCLDSDSMGRIWMTYVGGELCVGRFYRVCKQGNYCLVASGALTLLSQTPTLVRSTK